MTSSDLSPILTLEITDLSRGGAGVARDAEGRVVFVPFTAPGDQVRARILSSEKKYAQAQLVEVLRPSAQRVTPRCPAFGRCGGCQWQHLPYEMQWKTKVAGVLHALKRVLIEAPAPTELPAERIWEYRNRIQLRGEPSVGTLGFYASQSHELVDLQRCDIARPELNARWEETRLEGAKLPQAFKVELEVSENGKVRKAWNKKHAAFGFRQVHDEQNAKLRAWVSSALTAKRPILDLFGGSGNLSLPLAESSPEIHCVDFSSPSIRPPGTPPHFHFHRTPVLPWTRRLKPDGKTWSAIIDPPREGLGRDFKPLLESIERFGVREVVAVGCDPDSWARDLSHYFKRGWTLHRVGILDLFPHTPHVESLALLQL